MTTPNLDSIFARLKKPEEIYGVPYLWDMLKTWAKRTPQSEPYPGLIAFYGALLDLIQRQDEEIAYYKGHCESQVSLVESFRAELDELRGEGKP